MDEPRVGAVLRVLRECEERLERQAVGGGDPTLMSPDFTVTVVIGGRKIAFARVISRLTLASRMSAARRRCGATRC